MKKYTIVDDREVVTKIQTNDIRRVIKFVKSLYRYKKKTFNVKPYIYVLDTQSYKVVYKKGKHRNGKSRKMDK